MNREYHEGKSPKNIQARNTNCPRIQEVYITQVSDKIDGRMTMKLTQQFKKTENRLVAAL